MTKLKEPTKVCKICLKNFKNLTFFSMIHNDYCLCNDCRKRLKPRFIKFKHDGYPCMAIYEYDEDIKSLIYQIKGCYDIELSEIFLKEITSELKLLYYGRCIVPIPSYFEEDLKREFNHVIEIFNDLKLPVLPLLIKSENIKQASLKKSQRKNIAKVLKMSDIEKVQNKRILIVDDIYTTGSTIDAAIKLIQQGKPKSVEVLVIAKTRLK